LRKHHLQIAIRNGLILMVLSFAMGVAAAWAALHWKTAPVGAVLGALIGVGFAVWFARMWVVTTGLLHHSGLRRSDREGET
jgi:hypothetical protein